jgi:hypothetical protein
MADPGLLSLFCPCPAASSLRAASFRSPDSRCYTDRVRCPVICMATRSGLTRTKFRTAMRRQSCTRDTGCQTGRRPCLAERAEPGAMLLREPVARDGSLPLSRSASPSCSSSTRRSSAVIANVRACPFFVVLRRDGQTVRAVALPNSSAVRGSPAGPGSSRPAQRGSCASVVHAHTFPQTSSVYPRKSRVLAAPPPP